MPAYAAHVIVGEGTSPRNIEGSPGPGLRARNCLELASLLAAGPPVEIVVTAGILPDGDYVDVIRLLAARAASADVIVVGEDGTPIFRFEIENGCSRFERLYDPEIPLRLRKRGVNRLAPRSTRRWPRSAAVMVDAGFEK
jgi:hypothetical protein